MARCSGLRQRGVVSDLHIFIRIRMILDDHEKRLRFLLRAAGVRDGRVYIGPERVYLPITNRCNLSCRYCWFHSPGNSRHRNPIKDMSFKKFQGIVRDCVDLKVDTLCVSGEGEPTLHPRFSDVMSFLEKQPIAVTLFTNGAFSKERFDDVIKADEVVINFGATDREGYRCLHGEDFFEEVVQNIRRLARFRDSHKRSFRIAIDYVINKMNFNQLDRAKVLLKKLRVDFFEPTIMSEHDGNRDLRLDIPEGLLVGRGNPSPFCFNGWFYAITTLAGKVRFCFQRDQWASGSIERMSFRDVWFSQRFMRARLDGKCGRLGVKFKECQNCLHDSFNVKFGGKFVKKGAR